MSERNAKAAPLRPILEGALMVALSTVLGYFRVFRLPLGGSVDLSLVPIFVYCLRWGPKWGVGCGLVNGVLEYFLGGGIAISWQSMLLDYVAAEALIGLCGFAAGRRYGWLWGAVLGTFGRWVSLTVSGGLLWYMYMQESFLGIPMTNPWVYSVLLNGTLCLVVMLVDLVVLGLMEAQPYLRKVILVRQY